MANVKYQDCFDTASNLKPPFPKEHLEDLFGWLMTNTDIPKRGEKRSTGAAEDEGKKEEEFKDAEEEEEGNEEVLDPSTNSHPNDILMRQQQTMSVSSLQWYKSAILWLYKEFKLIVDEAVSEYLNEAING